MILTPEEMGAAEELLFAGGAEAEPLMDRAGEGIGTGIEQFFPHPGTCVAFVGDGHNGGDALVALRHLRDSGWQTAVRLVGDPDSLRPLTRKKLDQLGAGAAPPLDAIDLERPARPLVLIDGLLGIGARGELRPAYRKAAEQMNALRRDQAAHTVAIDIPSGLDGFTGEVYPGAVVADFTFTITYPKTGLLADGAANNAGRLALVPLPDIVAADGVGDSKALLITPAALAGDLPRRPFDMHKGAAGRVGIIAGSPGYTGAAILCANAALRGGAGLVTLFARGDAYPILAATAPPEVMVKPVESYSEARDTELDALAIGPGLGSGDWDDEMLDLILNDRRPAIVDADALNLLARNDPAKLADAPGSRLLTPHPGEMARLDATSGATRRERVEFLADKTGAVVLLKGARTVIASPSGAPTAFNSTGNPGMASGGAGDTLTGLCAALAAGGIDLYKAACIGSWINGRAAEIAVYEGGVSPESLAATDLPFYYGAAFDGFRMGDF